MISIHQGSILDSKADAIVNPANSFLNHGGGLAAVIDKAALTLNGHDYRNTAIAGSIHDAPRRSPTAQAMWQYKNDHAQAGLVPTGGAVMTSAGALPYKAIIHAVGPVWGGGQLHEATLLDMAHGRALRLAMDAGFKSIAFPAISCGIFGYPVKEAAKIAMRVADRYSLLAHCPDVEFWLFEDALFKAYSDALANL